MVVAIMKRPEHRRPPRPYDGAVWPVTLAGLDKVNDGGVMRCCLESLGDLYPLGPAALAAEGQIHQCKHAPDDPDHRLIFRDGTWYWHREGGEQ